MIEREEPTRTVTLNRNTYDTLKHKADEYDVITENLKPMIEGNEGCTALEALYHVKEGSRELLSRHKSLCESAKIVSDELKEVDKELPDLALGETYAGAIKGMKKEMATYNALGKTLSTSLQKAVDHLVEIGKELDIKDSETTYVEAIQSMRKQTLNAQKACEELKEKLKVVSESDQARVFEIAHLACSYMSEDLMERLGLPDEEFARLAKLIREKT